jgi:hypothetical protein
MIKWQACVKLVTWFQIKIGAHRSCCVEMSAHCKHDALGKPGGARGKDQRGKIRRNLVVRSICRDASAVRERFEKRLVVVYRLDAGLVEILTTRFNEMLYASFGDNEP